MTFTGILKTNIQGLMYNVGLLRQDVQGITFHQPSPTDQVAKSILGEVLSVEE